MGKLIAVLALLAVSASAAVCPFAKSLDQQGTDRVTHLIKTLDDCEFDKREAATKDLQPFVKNVAAFKLMKTALESASPEARSRLKTILDSSLAATWKDISQCLYEAIVKNESYTEYSLLMHTLISREDMATLRKVTRKAKGMKDIITFDDFPLEWAEVASLPDLSRPLIEDALRNSGNSILESREKNEILFERDELRYKIVMRPHGRHALFRLDSENKERAIWINTPDLFPPGTRVLYKDDEIALKPATFSVRLRAIALATSGVIIQDLTVPRVGYEVCGGCNARMLARQLAGELDHRALGELDAWVDAKD
jgi:hypothetical protein